MNLALVIQWILNGAVPLALVKVLFDRRRNRAAARTTEAAADVDKATVPDKVASSSRVTLEGELAALSKTFRDDRAMKEETIAWQTQQIKEMRSAHAQEVAEFARQVTERDERIRELEAKVRGLQQRVSDMNDELESMAQDLAQMHRKQDG